MSLQTVDENARVSEILNVTGSIDDKKRKMLKELYPNANDASIEDMVNKLNKLYLNRYGRTFTNLHKNIDYELSLEYNCLYFKNCPRLCDYVPNTESTTDEVIFPDLPANIVFPDLPDNIY